jgi:hypothetical protein
MNVRWRPAARRDDGLPQSVLAVRVVAGCEKAIHVADHGDGAAFSG